MQILEVVDYKYRYLVDFQQKFQQFQPSSRETIERNRERERKSSCCREPRKGRSQEEGEGVLSSKNHPDQQRNRAGQQQIASWAPAEPVARGTGASSSKTARVRGDPRQ